MIVAGGSGVRMGGKQPKQYLELGDRPILCFTVETFLRCPSIQDIQVVVPKSDVDYCQNVVLTGMEPASSQKPIHIVPGGERRQDSVRNGLAHLKATIQNPDTLVAIHDGVRPLVTIHDIERCISKARICGACVLGTPITDTLKTVDSAGIISSGPPRETVWRAQTPQVFRFGTITQAHEKALADGFESTDDAALMERMGVPVNIIQGSRFNLKITMPEDLVLAEALYRIQFISQ